MAFEAKYVRLADDRYLILLGPEESKPVEVGVLAWIGEPDLRYSYVVNAPEGTSVHEDIIPGFGGIEGEAREVAAHYIRDVRFHAWTDGASADTVTADEGGGIADTAREVVAGVAETARGLAGKGYDAAREGLGDAAGHIKGVIGHGCEKVLLYVGDTAATVAEKCGVTDETKCCGQQAGAKSSCRCGCEKDATEDAE